jgi:hypothetical protein
MPPILDENSLARNLGLSEAEISCAESGTSAKQARGGR